MTAQSADAVGFDRLAATLKKIRESRRGPEGRKLTQTELAEAVGTTQATVSKWERNKQDPSLAEMLALSLFYRTPLDGILREASATYRAMLLKHVGIEDANGKPSILPEGSFGATTAARVLTAEDEKTIDKLSEAATRLMDVGADIVEGIAALTGQTPTARSRATKRVSRARRRRRSTAS